jgi:hypothetical protein
VCTDFKNVFAGVCLGSFKYRRYDFVNDVPLRIHPMARCRLAMNQRSLRFEQTNCYGFGTFAGYAHNANTAAPVGCRYRDNRVIGWDNFLKPVPHSDLSTPTV